MSCTAFSPVFKLLASLVSGACAIAFIQGWTMGIAADGGFASSLWYLGALLAIAYTWWKMISSRTEIRATSLHQSWIWDKQVPIAELAYGKIVRVRRLEWLVVPRLYVRTESGKFAVFYAAAPEMVKEFERLLAELAGFRGTR